MKKKYNILYYSVVLIGILFVATSSCRKPKDNEPDPSVYLPKLTTVAIYNISETAAFSGGNITDEGGSSILERGVCWSTNASPTINHNKTLDGDGSGNYISAITGLTPNTNYHVRAYATNYSGTSYGNELTFNANNSAIVAPCNPADNSIVFNFQNLSFYSVNASTNGLSYGNYGLVGNGSSSDLKIEFIQEPNSGKFTTINGTSFIGLTECVVNGVFGGYHYVAGAHDTVYVIKNGNGKYSMTFCNLHFGSGSTTITFDSDGNLTSN
ncbi:hypothetical protein ACFL6I_06950 [candidate division KSB1 bacterium]